MELRFPPTVPNLWLTATLKPESRGVGGFVRPQRAGNRLRSMSGPDFQALFDEARHRYHQLADESGPQAALDFARALEGPLERPDLYDQIKAAAYTDMGAELDRPDYVAEGAAMFTKLSEMARPASTRKLHQYNRANALHEQFNMAARAASWAGAWLDHRDLLQEARAGYVALARDTTARKRERLQSLVNAAN